MRAFLLLLASAVAAISASVEINLRDFASTSLNTQVVITNTSNPVFGGTNVFALPVQKFQPRNGQVVATLHAGGYKALIGPYTIAFNVPDDTNSYTLSQLATNGSTITAIASYWYPSSNPSNYITATATNGLIRTNGTPSLWLGGLTTNETGRLFLWDDAASVYQSISAVDSQLKLNGMSMSGTNILDNTVNSNKLDSATRALLGGGGSGDISSTSSNNMVSAWTAADNTKVSMTNGSAIGMTASGTFSGNGYSLTNHDTSKFILSTNNTVDFSIGMETLKPVADFFETNTGPAVIVGFGDSLAGVADALCGIPLGAWYSLTNSYGYAGYAFRSLPAFGGFAGNATSVGGTAATLNQQGGSNWWGLWHSISGTASIQFGNNNVAAGDYGDTFKFAWDTWTNGGTFGIMISTNGGAWGTLVSSINAQSAALAFGITNFSLPLNYYRFQATNLTGTNIVFTPALWDGTSRGVVGAFFEKGGEQLSSFTTPDSIKYGIFTNLQPKLIIYHADEVSQGGYSGTELQLTNNVLPLFTNSGAKIVLVGNAYRNDDPIGTNFIAESELLRRLASRYGAAFWDTAWVAQNWGRMTNLDYMVGGADVIHWKINGSRFVADHFLRRGGIMAENRLGLNASTSGRITAGTLSASTVTLGTTTITNLSYINLNAPTNKYYLNVGTVSALTGNETSQSDPTVLGWPHVFSSGKYAPTYICESNVVTRFFRNFTAAEVGGKTNITIIQRYGCTNATGATVTNSYTTRSAVWQEVGGGTAATFGTEGIHWARTASAAGVVAITNSYSIDPSLTNHAWGIYIGRFNIPTAAETMWWTGGEVWFY